MKDLKEFVKTLVKIEFLDHCNSFGFYPFQMFVEDKEGKSTFCSLDLGGDIASVYKAFNDYFKHSPKRIYLAVDFPAADDIENDFVCIFIFQKGNIMIYAKPYNSQTGESLPDILQSNLLNNIERDLNHFLTVNP